jgi:hypothetical protein
MTPTTLPGFLNKKEIEANFGRSYRTLTRDITRAVKTGDADILQHLKLVTDDDTVREGNDVTLDMIQELSNNGLHPMWLAEESWVAEWCSRRSIPRSHDEISIQPDPESKTFVPTSTNDSAAGQILQQRINDLTKQNELLVGQLQIKDDQIRAANQQAEQSQQLMRDLHVLLKNVQDGLLGEGSRSLIESPRKTSSQPQQPIAVPEKTAALKRRTGRAIKSTSKKTTRKRSPLPKTEPVQPPADRLHRWFPTFLGSNQRRKK